MIAVDIYDIELTYSVSGTGNRLDANPVDSGENTGSLNVTLKPGMGREEEVRTMNIMREELAKIPGVQYEFSRPTLMSFASPVQIEISGFDLNGLDRTSQSILQKMADSDRARSRVPDCSSGTFLGTAQGVP